MHGQGLPASTACRAGRLQCRNLVLHLHIQIPMQSAQMRLHHICGYRLPDCEQGYFTFYVVLIFIWGLVAAAVAITLPIIESRAIVFAFLGSFPGLGFLKAYAERTAAAKDAKHEVGSCLLV